MRLDLTLGLWSWSSASFSVWC